MSKRQWRPFDDECPYCGCRAEVFTISDKDNYAYDQEDARCDTCQCPGMVCVEEDGSASISWHDEPDCDCEWCLANSHLF